MRKTIIISFLLGCLGVLAAFGIMHLVNDHKNYHAVENYLVKLSAERAAEKAK